MSFSWSPVEIVSDDEFADEPLGTKQKFWVENPDDDRLWLFKFARVTGAGTLGEDWAEWVVHHVGDLLGTPTAKILPATCDGRRGIVSRSVVGSVDVARLVHGNSLLAESDAAVTTLQASRDSSPLPTMLSDPRLRSRGTIGTRDFVLQRRACCAIS